MTDTRLPTALAALAEPPPTRLLHDLGATLGVGDRYLVVDAPTATGSAWVAFNDRGINLLTTATDEEDFVAQYVAQWGPRPLRPAAAPPPRLVEALRPERRAEARTLRYDLGGLSPFQQAVLRKTAEIPPGEVRPYAWVAREVGQPGAVRAVGTALGRNPVPILIPCHRVVRSDGRIGNYALGSAMKSRLLTEEGVDLAELVDLANRGIRYVGTGTVVPVYCLPTCVVARSAAPADRRLFRSAAAAVGEGYKACSRCRPPADSG